MPIAPGMVRFLIRRILGGAFVVLVVTLAVFVLFGPVLRWHSNISPARLYAGKNPSPEQIQRVSALLGLDKPYYVQYGITLRRLVLGPTQEERERVCPGSTAAECDRLLGRFGSSFAKQVSVDRLIWDAFPVTVSLTMLAALMWLLMAIPIGIYSAIRPRSLFDRVTIVFVLIGQSLPVYYFGLLALYFLSYKYGLFPLSGYEPFSFTDPWPWLYHLLLPAFVLALQFAAIYARITRSQMLDQLSEDYVRTARAKGAAEPRIVIRHAFRNAMLPIVTMFGLDLGLLLGGAILIEVTFGLQGLGALAVDAAKRLDVPTTAGIVLFSAIIIVVANIIVDVVNASLDPRIRLE
ncbi:MAG: ABC transporter permease [Gaiellales bacterium]